MSETASETAAPQPWLSLARVTKRFGGMVALRDVSLDIASGEIHCLLGENGAGKSTLCNVIFGIHSPDEGAMLLDGKPYKPSGPPDALRQRVAMVHQHFSLVSDLSVVDNLLLGQVSGVLRRKEAAQRVADLAAQFGLELDPFARIADLSVGERQRVEIVKCLMRDPKLLVLDEPTAVLLPREIDALLGICKRVAQQGCGVVLVTHKLAEIREVADRVTVLRGGEVVMRSASPAADMDNLVQAMIKHAPNGTSESTLASDGMSAACEADHPHKNISHSLQNEVLQIDGLSVRDAQHVVRLDNFTLVVSKGEIVGVAGVEGNGQSELAAMLAGMMKPTEGRFFVKGQDLTGHSPHVITQAGVGVVPEDRHATGCITGLSVAENIFLNRFNEFSSLGRLDRQAMCAAARELMQRFDVRAASENQAFSGLSGGNQQKAVLARELTLNNLVFLLAAQPTRGLDVGAVAAVYAHIRAARDRGVGVLLISSELDELLRVADRIVVLYRGKIMGVCPASQDQRARIAALMAGQTA
jgi:simple sugar transport system ATP-binding protein